MLTEAQIQDLQNLKNKLDSGHVVVDAKQLDTIVTECAQLKAAVLSLKPIVELLAPPPGQQPNLMGAMASLAPKLMDPNSKMANDIRTAFEPIAHLFEEVSPKG